MSLSALDPAQVAEAAKAFEALAPHDVSLLSVVRDWILSREQKSQSVTFRELFDRYLELKRGRHPDYVRQLRDCCDRWPKMQNRMVSELTYKDFEKTVMALDKGARDHATTYLTAAFNYGIKKGWATENPANRLDRPAKEKREVEVLSVDECERLLRTAMEHDQEVYGNIVLGLWAGVRPEDEANASTMGRHSPRR